MNNNNNFALARRAIINSQEQLNIKYKKNLLKLGKFNIIYLNINSLRNKLDELEELIHETQNSNRKIVHFICLTESRLNDEDTRYYNINGYTAFHCTRADGYGGTVLFVHESLSCNLLAKKSQSNIELILVNIVELSLNIIVVYKQPPVSSDILINLLIPLLENRGKSIVLGDFNINLLNDSIATNQYTHTMISRGLIFLNKVDEKFATRVAERTINHHALTSKTVIDHVLTNCLNFSYTFSIADTPISDHKIIAIAFDDCKKSNFIEMEKTVTLKRLNEQNFNTELENI